MNDEFSKRLRQAIDNSGKTQREIAKLLGVTEVSLSRWASGTRIPRAVYVEKLAEAVGISSAWLLTGQETVNHDDGITLSFEEFGTLAICAIRYCHGRQTYMPEMVRGAIRPKLAKLEDRDLTVMINDVEWMNEFDYGDPNIDKPGWLQWREDLLEERRRRNDHTD